MHIVHDLLNKTRKECTNTDEVKQEMIRIYSSIDPGVYFYDTLEYIEIEKMSAFEIMTAASDVMKILDQNQLVVTDKDDETSIYFTF